jgi:hypothetical protein
VVVVGERECEKERLLESIIHKPAEMVSLLLRAYSCYIYSALQKVNLLFFSPLLPTKLLGGHAAAAAAPKDSSPRLHTHHGKIMKWFVPHNKQAHLSL